ncbi:MAG TPA: cytochrome o ubiquinol oxidase subunit III [Candidatus Paceibacterota bacterium]|nr:cytochrome o ubiquinol oxidase subunit III [Candidatus Paceibacterota bacterium]
MNDKHIFGFWVYLMTDLIMFAALFAAYAVLRTATFGGPGLGSLLSLNGALAETLILLTSSFTCGLALLAVRTGRKGQALAWFAGTFALGATFLGLELSEFSRLAAAGNGPQANAALSSFFTLVGTHGLHIAVGLLWMAVGMVQVQVRGLTPATSSKLERLALFWHFLDIVWIFIFTVVYLMGAAL